MDRACDRFEAAWRAGARPRITERLGDPDGPERARLLRELVLLDAYYRRRAGETPAPDDYRRRFPELDPAWLADALDGAGGGPPTPTALRADATLLRPAVTPAEAVAVGRTFGDYELLEELGRGVA